MGGGLGHVLRDKSVLRYVHELRAPVASVARAYLSLVACYRAEWAAGVGARWGGRTREGEGGAEGEGFYARRSVSASRGVAARRTKRCET